MLELLQRHQLLLLSAYVANHRPDYYWHSDAPSPPAAQLVVQNSSYCCCNDTDLLLCSVPAVLLVVEPTASSQWLKHMYTVLHVPANTHLVIYAAGPVGVAHRSA
jgi:hypothetical protein